MHLQITYNRSIWKGKDWTVTRLGKLKCQKFVPDKREEKNNAMKKQRRDLLGLQVCWLFPNRHWRKLYLPMDCRGYGVYGTSLSGWYECDMNLLFVGGDDWGPLSGALRGGQEPTLMFVGGSNRGPLGGALQGITSPSHCCTNPSSLDLWIGFSYNFDTTNILVIF